MAKNAVGIAMNAAGSEMKCWWVSRNVSMGGRAYWRPTEIPPASMPPRMKRASM